MKVPGHGRSRQARCLRIEAIVSRRSVSGACTAGSATSSDSSAAGTRLFTREVTFPVPPESRLLQVRQRWSSVDDWAPVLGGLWVESEDAGEYALGELGRAAYEADQEAEGLLRRRWELS